jgi:glycosyltransferase involved in cell wall biosynthesis
VKILFLSGWYPNRIHPHLGNFVQRHAEAVATLNEVASLFVCSDSNLKDRKFEVEAKNKNGVFTVNVYYKKISNTFLIGPLLKFMRSRHAYRIGFKEISKHFEGKPDVVHLNVAYPAGTFAMQLKRRLGIPYIVTEHSTKYHLRINPVESYLTKKICNQAELVCPVSNHLKKVMQEKGFGKNFEVVPNVVNTNLFTIAEKSPNQKTRIIHISTLVEWQKNIRGMMRVIKKLSETRSDFELHIISEKDSTAAIAFAEQIGLRSSVVHFHPHQPIEKVAGMLHESDIFLLFSNVENLPCVIIESLASGVPVVATNVGGISELITEKNGMLVNAKDEEGLFQRLNTMLDKHYSYDKKEMRKDAIENFSYNVIGKKFTDIYRQIVFKKLNNVN